MKFKLNDEVIYWTNAHGWKSGIVNGCFQYSDKPSRYSIQYNTCYSDSVDEGWVFANVGEAIKFELERNFKKFEEESKKIVALEREHKA